MTAERFATSSMENIQPRRWVPEPYMRKVLKFLLERQFGGVFADPGAGKTAILLHLFAILHRKKYAKRMLVLVKNRILHTVWQPEIKKWGLPLRTVVLQGGKKENLLRSEFDVALINYEGLRWLSTQKGLDKIFDVLVCDESSMLKDTRTQRFKSLKSIAHHFLRRYIMTGTPATESLLNLFGQIYVVDMGETLSPYITNYRNEFFHPTGYMGYDWQLKAGSEEKIFERIAPLIIRVPPELIKRPPLAIVDRQVQLSAGVMKQYMEMEKEFILNWERGAITAANAAVATGKLRQIANGAIYDEHHETHLIHEEKIGEVVDLVEELQGKSVFVLYEYNHDIDAILRAFPNAAYIGQGVSQAQAAAHVANFNSGRLPILAGQVQSVAHGLNLQADSHNVIFFSLPWSLEYYIQAIARVWRKGQKNRVTVYRVLSTGTVDESVAKALARKDATQSALLEALEARYGRPKRGVAIHR